MRLLDDFRSALGPGAVLEGADAVGVANSPWTRLGTPLAVLRPRTTDEVSLILDGREVARFAAREILP